MKKYFELRENNEVLYGVLKNIPDEVSEEDIIERIEEKDETNTELILVNKVFGDKYIDIEFDWVELDYLGGIDEDLIVVDEILEKSFNLNIEDKVVFTALSIMKKQNNLSISDVMSNAFDIMTK